MLWLQFRKYVLIRNHQVVTRLTTNAIQPDGVLVQNKLKPAVISA